MTTATVDQRVQHTAAPAAPVKCAVHAVDAGLHQHLSEGYWQWRRMYDADPHAAPLQHPDCVLSEILHNPLSWLQPVLISAERGGACVGLGALAPKSITTRQLGGIGIHIALNGLRLAGNDWLRKGDADAGPQLLDTALHHVRAVDADFLLVPDVETSSPLAEALSRGVPRTWLQFRHPSVQPHRCIELPATREAYWSRFSSKTLGTMRRKLKKFGQSRLERITNVAQVPKFLEVAHAISLQTWQTRQFGLRVNNDAAELHQLTTLAQDGLLRCYLWFSNDEPVAFIIGNQDKDRFHYEEVGYATPFAKHSPGQMMIVQVLDDLFSYRRPTWFDFGSGDADYKQFFANHAGESGTIWLFPPTMRNCALLAQLHACRLARQVARQIVVACGWASSARQWIRYGRAKPVTTAPEETEE